MSRFFVGQRVRVVRADYPENEGIEVVITGINQVGMSAIDGQTFVGYGVNITNRFGNSAIAREDQLEPITDRNTKVEWSECAWQPNGVSA